MRGDYVNKEKLEKYLEKSNAPISRDFLNALLITDFIANIAIFFIFKNVVATIISSVLYIVYAIVLIRNKNYLRDQDSLVKVKTYNMGYMFWLFLLFTVLLELKLKLSIWFFVIEFALLIISFVLSKKANDKMIQTEDFVIDYTSFKRYSKIGITVGISFYIVLSIIGPLTAERLVWYLLSTFIFVITLILGHLFVSALIIYIGFLKYLAE